MNKIISLTLLLLWIACAWWAAVGALRNWRAIRIKTAVIYLLYVAVVPTVSLIPWLVASPETYSRLYWTVDLLHDFFMCVFGIQLITFLIPKRFAYLWSWGFMLLLLFAYYKTLNPLPARADLAFLNLTLAGDFTVLTILVALVFFPGIEWNKKWALMTAGIVLMTLGNIVPQTQWLMGRIHGPWLWWGIQIAPLPGLVVLGKAVRIVVPPRTLFHIAQ